MVVKCIINGVKVHGPPYTKAEEDDFYSRQGVGTMYAPRTKEAPTKPASKPPKVLYHLGPRGRAGKGSSHG
jgi:hypothetical protein